MANPFSIATYVNGGKLTLPRINVDTLLKVNSFADGNTEATNETLNTQISRSEAETMGRAEAYTITTFGGNENGADILMNAQEVDSFVRSSDDTRSVSNLTSISLNTANAVAIAVEDNPVNTVTLTETGQALLNTLQSATIAIINVILPPPKPPDCLPCPNDFSNRD